MTRRTTAGFERCDDRDPRYGGRPYDSVDELLTDGRVEIVVNLTPVSAHHAVTKAALLAGKHVYSEKPFASTLPDGEELVALAERLGLWLSGSPATVYSRSFRTLRKAVVDGLVGQVRLVYAEMDAGALPYQAYTKWFNPRGIRWPYGAEATAGCVLEHAGYHLSWLTTPFGPVVSVTSQAVPVLTDRWKDTVADGWPWAEEIIAAFTRLTSLPRPLS